MGRGPALSINGSKFLSRAGSAHHIFKIIGPAGPGPAHHIFKTLGPARPITFSVFLARPITFFKFSARPMASFRSPRPDAHHWPMTSPGSHKLFDEDVHRKYLRYQVHTRCTPACMWRPGCFPGAWRRTSWHFQVTGLHLQLTAGLCPLHKFHVLSNVPLMSKRSGRRMPPAKRSALYQAHCTFASLLRRVYLR